VKKLLVIGSTVVDVIIHLNHLPRTAEDVNVSGQTMAMGGCAYNVSEQLRHFGVPYTLFSPVGAGVYGDFVRAHLAAQGIASPIPTPQRENGCCYCFVEDGGERTFISYHGAEYAFYPEWFDALDASELSAAYLCGLEVEEPTGGAILDFLEASPQLAVYFAPGPRIVNLQEDKLNRLYDLHPILHLNMEEVLSGAKRLTGRHCPDFREAAALLQQRTGNTVIATLGPDGCWYDDGRDAGHIPGVPATVADTIGAGDAHIGAVMAQLQMGTPLPQALAVANRVAAAVVSTEGARLDDGAFRAAIKGAGGL